MDSIEKQMFYRNYWEYSKYDRLNYFYGSHPMKHPTRCRTIVEKMNIKCPNKIRKFIKMYAHFNYYHWYDIERHAFRDGLNCDCESNNAERMREYSLEIDELSNERYRIVTLCRRGQMSEELLDRRLAKIDLDEGKLKAKLDKMATGKGVLLDFDKNIRMTVGVQFIEDRDSNNYKCRFCGKTSDCVKEHPCLRSECRRVWRWYTSKVGQRNTHWYDASKFEKEDQSTYILLRYLKFKSDKKKRRQLCQKKKKKTKPPCEEPRQDSETPCSTR